MAEVSTLTLNDGTTIPQLGFGVFLIPPDETAEATGTAIEAGYRLIDTASIYGNEEGVGKAIAESGVPREEFVVTTKVWNDDHGYDKTLRAFDLSLEKLGLDHVELYLIHWPRPKLGLYIDTWKALERLRADGRVRSIGVSNFAPEQLKRLVSESDVAPAVNQVELHPGMPETELRDFHKALGITTQAWSPIGRNQGILEHPLVLDIAASHGRSPAQVVLRWHVQLGVIAIPKSGRPSRIRGNLEVFDFELSAQEMARLTALDIDSKVRPDPSLHFDLS